MTSIRAMYRAAFWRKSLYLDLLGKCEHKQPYKQGSVRNHIYIFLNVCMHYTLAFLSRFQAHLCLGQCAYCQNRLHSQPPKRSSRLKARKTRLYSHGGARKEGGQKLRGQPGVFAHAPFLEVTCAKHWLRFAPSKCTFCAWVNVPSAKTV